MQEELTPEENDEIWTRTFRQIRRNEKRRKVRRITYATAVIIAISVCVGLYQFRTAPTIYQAGNIELADGTQVTLLKGATLQVDHSFPGETREVVLKGNAFFKVAKSAEHPFIVHGSGYETKVLGTVFKVSQSSKSFTVDLFEGKVLIYKTGRHKEPIALFPKQTFNNYGVPEAGAVTKTVEINAVKANENLATLTFTKCPLRDAILVIEKTYGIRVLSPKELENTKITISLPEKTAAQFLQTLAIQLNLNIKQRNDSIFELEK
ncbi:MAG: FecR family protein [Sphingobacteriaceae bacterium]|nr:FecR family protein [Sphingobacteriaceae bacterium]